MALLNTNLYVKLNGAQESLRRFYGDERRIVAHSMPIVDDSCYKYN
jgi:hypothetical protein